MSTTTSAPFSFNIPTSISEFADFFNTFLIPNYISINENAAHINTAQTFSALQTFANGLTISGSTTPNSELFSITNGVAIPSQIAGISQFVVDTSTGNTILQGSLTINGQSAARILDIVGNPTWNPAFETGDQPPLKIFPMIVPAGSAISPSVVLRDSNGTGFWFPSGNMFSLQFANNEKLRIDSNGNVGLGFSSLFAPLTVKLSSIGKSFEFKYTSIGNTNSATIETINRQNISFGAYSNAVYGETNFGANPAFDMGDQPASGTDIAIYNSSTTSDIHLWTNSSEQMRIKSSGYIGIGTKTPLYLLHVNTDTYAAKEFYATNSIDIGFAAGSSTSAVRIGKNRTLSGYSLIDFITQSSSSYSSQIFKSQGASTSNGSWNFYQTGSGAISFFNSSTESVRIDSTSLSSDFKIGFGELTSQTLSYPVNIISSSNFPIVIDGAIDNITKNYLLTISGSGGTNASPTALSAPNSVFGGVSFGSYNGSVWTNGTTGGAEIKAITSSGGSATWTTVSQPARLSFYTSSTGNSREVFRIETDNSLRYYGQSGNYVGLKIAAAAGSNTWTLPAFPVSPSGFYMVTTNGSKTLGLTSVASSINTITNLLTYTRISIAGFPASTYGTLINAYGIVRSNKYISGNIVGNSSKTYRSETPNNVLTNAGYVATNINVKKIDTNTTNLSGPRSIAFHPSGMFLYCVSQNSNMLNVYRIDANSGGLTYSSQIATGSNPTYAECDPSGRFIYVANASAGTISGYTINQSTGDLTSMGAAFSSSLGMFNIVCDPTGNFLYAPNSTSSHVRAFKIDQSSGNLVLINTYSTNSSAQFAKCDPTGRFLYVGIYGAGPVSNVETFTIDKTTGALASVGNIATQAKAYGIECESTGRFVYVTNIDNALITIYNINQSTGALTLNSTKSTVTSPFGITSDYLGKFLFVYSSTTTTIDVFSINNNGTLNYISSITTTSSGYSLACDPTGRFLYVAQSAGITITAYNISSASFSSILMNKKLSVKNFNTSTEVAADIYGIVKSNRYFNGNIKNNSSIQYSAINANNMMQTLSSVTGGNGTPTSVGTTATGTQPQYVACDPTGKFVYVVNLFDNNVQAYTINQTTGALTSVGTTATGTNPRSVACDPTGRFVYVANYSTATVQAYTINQTTGALTSVGSYSTGTAPFGVACEPTGKFVYVANYSSASVSAYTINQTTGALTSVGTTATGTNPYFVACDPTGRFVYVTNGFNGAGGNTVQAYTINQTTGALTSVGTTATGTAPYAVACDPTGRFVYVVNISSNTVSAYTINQTTGALTSVGTTATGTQPFGVACDPTGKFVYVANNGSTTFSMYTINQTTGALTSIGTITAGTNPRGVACDPTGRFVYVANSGSPYSVSAYYTNTAILSSLTIGKVTSQASMLELSSDSAAKPTTNTWTIPSDARMKTITGNFHRGLRDIKNLNPIVYTYNGKYGSRVDGKKYVSIIAQDIENDWPSMVTRYNKNSEEENRNEEPEVELRSLNTHELQWGLVNAVKELYSQQKIIDVALKSIE